MEKEVYPKKDLYDINDLLEIMKILRGENGCAWDREQNHESIRMNVLEEAYEVMEAIDAKDSELLREELGDLLLQVVFHAQLENEADSFDFDGVCDGICKKLIYRHPHVFGNIHVDGSDEVLKNWDSLKSRSKGQETALERLTSVPKLLPALMRGDKVIKRAVNSGLQGDTKEFALRNLKEKVDRLEQILSNGGEIEGKIGEVLLACCNLSNIYKKDSEKSLTTAINRFIMQFGDLEAKTTKKGASVNQASEEEIKELFSAEDNNG